MTKGFLDSASILGKESRDTVHAYLDDLCAPVEAALKDCEFDPADGSFDEDEPGRTIARIFLDGYLNGYPRCSAVRLFHVDRILQPPEIVQQELFNPPIIYGSPIITNALFGLMPDARFAQYFVRWTSPLQVETVKQISRSYIDACAVPLAIELDDFCLSIGGHLHAATVTRDAGFQWLPGFAPILLA
jgi:hypothetical protein